MVNGRSLEEELKRIDNFFDSLTEEEFEKIAFEAGLGETKKVDSLNTHVPLNAIYCAGNRYKQAIVDNTWHVEFNSLQGAA